MSDKTSKRYALPLVMLIVLSLCVVPFKVSGFYQDKGTVREKDDDRASTDQGANTNETRPRYVTKKNAESAHPAIAQNLTGPFTGFHIEQPATERKTLVSTITEDVLRRSLLSVNSMRPIFEPAPGASATDKILIPFQDSSSPIRPGSIDVYFMIEYRRDEMKYTGSPTLTGVFPQPVPPVSFPEGPIFFIPSAFEPNDEQLTSYASVSIKDYGFDRLRFNTQVSFRYSGDLDGTSVASPFLGIRDGFVGRRIFEPLTIYTDVGGFLGDDRVNKFNVRVGRQFIYGAEPIRLDGATFTINHSRFDLDVFGGRRVTFFSDPDERAVYGHNLNVRATPRTSFKYDFAHYIDNSHRFQVQHSLGESWVLDGKFFLLDTDPVDLGFGAYYVPFDGKTKMTFNFLQKLTSNDFIYDIAYRSFALNQENQIRRRLFPIPPSDTPSNGNGRLNLFDINPYTQFYFDVYRNLSQAFGVGGTVWVRHVNDSDNRGPFDNAFQEYRASADYFPSSALELGAEYRFRHLNRGDPNAATEFDDIRREGETQFHEVYANGSYNLFKQRIALEAGLFYRMFDTQSRIISLNNVDTLGFTGAVKLRLARGYKLLLEYGRDEELPFFNPDIDYTQSFRVRFEWHFNR